MRRMALIFSALPFVLVSCASHGGNGAGPTASSIPTLRSLADVKLPLDYYSLTTQQEDTINQAAQKIAGKCLMNLGYSGPTKNLPVQIQFPFGAMRRSRTFGFIEERVAARYGYQQGRAGIVNRDGKVVSGASKNTGPEQVEGSQRIDPAAMAALTGRTKIYNRKPVPPGGCSGEAERQLQQGVRWPDGVKQDSISLVNFVGEIGNQATARATQDSRYLTMSTRWSSCMKRSGYSYRSPEAATEDRRWSSRAGVSSEEIRTAVTDSRCKSEVNYLGVFVSLQREYEDKSIEKNSEALRGVKQNLDARVRRAVEVLGKTP